MEKEFLLHLLSSETNLGKIVSSGFKSEYLDSSDTFSPVRALFDVIVTFFLKYKKAITGEQLVTYLNTQPFSKDEIKSILLLYEEVKGIQPAQSFDFLSDQIKLKYSKRILQLKLNNGTDYLLQNDVEKALKTFKEGIFTAENVLQKATAEGSIQESVLLRARAYSDIKKGITRPGLKTGFATLDKLSGGMKGGELIVVMAGPGEGKSTFLLNVGYHNQIFANKNIFYVSIENPKVQLERRYDSLHSGLPYSRLRDGTLNEEEEQIYKKALNNIVTNKSVFYIFDQPICSPQMIAAKLAELETKYKFDLIIVDYLGLLRPDKTSSSIWQDVGNIALGLREIARVYNVPVLTATQTRRENQKGQRSRYETYDVALSFMIIYHADTVLALKILNPDILNTGLGICEINAHIVKCRDGSLGDFVIDANFERMKLQERTYIV